jgi:hypothetical protein
MPRRLLKWQRYRLKGATHKIALTEVLSCMEKETAPCILEHTTGATTHCHILYFSHVGRLVGIVGCHLLVLQMIILHNI